MIVSYLKNSCVCCYYHSVGVIIKIYINVAMCKTEGMEKWPIVYLRQRTIPSCHMVIIYLKQHLAWLWQNVRISIIKIWITTLEMCVAVLCTMSTYWYPKYIIISEQFKCYSDNMFSCVSPNYTLCHLWQTSFQWKVINRRWSNN